MSEREDVGALAEVIEAHSGTTVDLGTPRQYTGHGGWNTACLCDHLYGSQEDVDRDYSPHIAAEILASPWLAAHDEWVRAEALAPVRALAWEMSGDDCECERYWTRRLARVLPPERMAGEAGSE